MPVLAKDGPPNDSRRWDNEIQAFEKADKAKPPPSGAVLFIGSSTIRMWKTLAADFPGRRSSTAASAAARSRTARSLQTASSLPTAPVILRAGGNDINAGKSPERVFDDFKAFVTALRGKLPKVRIAYMTINATPSRWANVEREKKANRLIQEYIEAHPGLDLQYIDTFDATMALTAPRRSCFSRTACISMPTDTR